MVILIFQVHLHFPISRLIAMSKLSEFFAAPPETVPVQIFMVGGGGSG